MWLCWEAPITRRMLKGTEKSPPFKHSEGKKSQGCRDRVPTLFDKETKKKPPKKGGVKSRLLFRRGNQLFSHCAKQHDKNMSQIAKSKR
jgi:hypothetical protein